MSIIATRSGIPCRTMAGFFVVGGPDFQYLGFFTCVFCTEYNSDSINNEYGKYGSQYSPTSIRNEYSQYGSPYSSNSACSEYASHPPKVYNSARTIYYGELTLNRYRADAITHPNTVNWLTNSVCRH